MLSRLCQPWLWLLACAAYVVAVWNVTDLPRPKAPEGLRIRMPVLVQVLQAGGDRYLAADLNVVRIITVDTELQDEETFRIQAALSEDVSLLNPRHEDNYYMTASMLPWQGYVSAGQDVLLRASNARTWDFMPPFFYAFNAGYFERDYFKAAQWAEVASQRTFESNAAALREMAAKWSSKGDDPALAIDLIERLKSVTAKDDARSLRLLDARIERLRGLQALRQAASRRAQEKPGQVLQTLEQLRGEGWLSSLPEDPLGVGYTVDTQGLPQLAQPVRKRTTQ